MTDGLTDGQTDRNLLAIPRLHYMQRGKKSDLHQSFTKGKEVHINFSNSTDRDKIDPGEDLQSDLHSLNALVFSIS